MPGLTPKREAFCQQYVVDQNATQAAIRAGYSEATANPHLTLERGGKPVR